MAGGPNNTEYIKKNNFKWEYLEGARFAGDYDMPELMPAHGLTPRFPVPFNAAATEKHADGKWVHFYIHDYQFERFWRDADRYLGVLKRFEGVISPDFSMLLNMPQAQQIWNCWRNKALTYYMQRNGINTIPNVGWSDASSYEWAFAGIPEDSVLAVTSQGCMGKNHVCKQSFVNGLHELARRKHPEKLVVYGEFPEEWRKRFPMPVVVLSSFSRTHLRKEA